MRVVKQATNMSQLQGFDDFFNLDGRIVLVTGGKFLHEKTITS